MLFEPSVLTAYEADDLVVRLVAMFSEDAPRLAAVVVSAADADSRARAAHALRGCALNLGANTLATVCGAIERAVRTKDEDSTNTLLRELETVVDATIVALRDHCSGMQRAPL